MIQRNISQEGRSRRRRRGGARRRRQRDRRGPARIGREAAGDSERRGGAARRRAERAEPGAGARSGSPDRRGRRSSGELTQEQADALKQRVEAEGVPIFGVGPPAAPRARRVGLHRRPRRRCRVPRFDRGRASRADSRAARRWPRWPRSRARPSRASSRRSSTLRRRTSPPRSRAGRLTQAQADEIRADLQEHIDRLVNGELPGPPPGFDHRAPADRPGRMEDASATHTV